MLKAIDSVKRYNRATLIGALITSYLHQAHYLSSKGAGYFAYLPPAIFDTAMVAMLIVVRTHGIVKDAKRWAMAVFIGAALLSATVNFAAPGDLGMRLVFALVVVLVIGVELVAGRIRPDFTAIDKQAADLMTAVNKIRANNIPAPTAPGHTTAPAAVVDPPAQPAATDPQTVPDVPAHLLPTARFSIVQHEQTTGQPITADDLALRLNISPAVAGSLITAIRATNPAPARLNGHTPTLTGGVR
nr:DUF2637 domain-containing protein [Actinoplanes cyaneus]